MKATTATISLIAWVTTLFGAYYFGKQSPVRTETIQQDTATAGGKLKPAGKQGLNPNTPNSEQGTASANKTTNNGPLSTRDIQNLLARCSNQMRTAGMQNPRGMLKVMALLDAIPDDQVQAALAESLNVKERQAKMMIMMSLLGRWGETDGPAAMAWADANAKDQGMLGNVAKAGAMAAWAEKDPEAVWEWFQTNKAKSEGNGEALASSSMVLNGLFTQLASKDPAAAVAKLDTLEGGNRMMALSGILQASAFDPETRKLAMESIATLKDTSLKDQAQQMMMQQLSMFSPDEAMKYAQELPADQQTKAKEAIGQTMMMSDPHKGAELILAGATDENRSQKVSQVVGSWMHTNLNAAGKWLNEQPQGEYLDSARNMLASRTAESNPAEAVTWAAKIDNRSLRIHSLADALKKLADKAPDAIAPTIEKLALPAEDAAQIHAKLAEPAPAKEARVERFGELPNQR